MEIAEVTASRVAGGRVEVDVTLSRPGTTKQNVPLYQQFPGGVYLPRQGESVVIERLDDGSYIAMQSLSGSQNAAVSLTEGDLHFQWSDGTRFSVTKSGSSYTVNIDSDGDVNINASGNVSIGSTGSLTLNGTDWDNHTHSYSWGDAGGSGNTGTPQ